MGKRWIVGLVLLGMGIMHSHFETASAQDMDSSVSDALPLDEPNAAPGPDTSDAESTAEPPAAAYTPPPADPGEFSPPLESAENAAPSPTTGTRSHGNDENIDYRRVLRKVDLHEQPKGYRHHALGPEGYRPNTIALGVGGRMPGVGLMFDYSWNRVGAGVSISHRPNVGFSELKNAIPSEGQTFGNIWLHYNLIPFNVSPYILAGLETAYNTKSSVNAIAGIGVEARFWTYVTLFVEYIRHETTEEGFPGLALGIAF